MSGELQKYRTPLITQGTATTTAATETFDGNIVRVQIVNASAQNKLLFSFDDDTYHYVLKNNKIEFNTAPFTTLYVKSEAGTVPYSIIAEVAI